MGTKRSVLTDEKGLPLTVVISGANTHDSPEFYLPVTISGDFFSNMLVVVQFYVPFIFCFQTLLQLNG